MSRTYRHLGSRLFISRVGIFLPSQGGIARAKGAVVRLRDLLRKPASMRAICATVHAQ
jgi:hypothetical protein